MSQTPAGRVLAEEIARSGPIPFSRFMQVALYHPEFGYYARDRFGVAGDFYTAEQIQPVFGRLIAAVIRDLARTLDGPTQVVEVGAGRAEMAAELSNLNYTPIDIAYGELPEHVTGIIFSNELFDALPVDVAARHDHRSYELRIALDGDRFVWTQHNAVEIDIPDGVRVRETQTARVEMLERLARRLDRGYILTVDYGYTDRELLRFPEGTLMSYRRHQALDDVLAEPGERDITAHVDFTALKGHGEQLGLDTMCFETLAQTLLRAGELDEFASALSGQTEAERARHRLQLKTLLFGMGETFRVLLQKK